MEVTACKTRSRGAVLAPVGLRVCCPQALLHVTDCCGPPAGIVFTVCCEPYLESEYGADYMSETPVKLLDRLLYGQRHHIDEEVRSHSKMLPCAAQRAWKVGQVCTAGGWVRNGRYLHGRPAKPSLRLQGM